MASGPAALRLEAFIGNPSKELLSGLVVAFAMIPEAIAFSGIAGVDPQVGLFGAFCLSITIACVGGRSAMITSATGSTALLMTGLVATGEARGPGLGLAYLLVAGVECVRVRVPLLREWVDVRHDPLEWGLRSRTGG